MLQFGMATLVFLDTSKLRFYRNAPDNYAHFVLGNLYEVFVGLHDAKLLESDLELVHNNPDPAYESLYEVFSDNPIRRAQAAPEGARTLALSESVDWNTLQVARDPSPTMPLFTEHVWKRLLERQPTAASTVTWISRRKRASGNRYVINESVVTRVLAQAARARGLSLEIVDFADLSFQAQVEQMAKSRVLIGIHGAGLVNTLFLPPTAAVVELLPHRLFNAEFFRLMGLRKGNAWLRVDPSWSVPSLYNLLLACTRSGHTKTNRFYRDRNGVYAPSTIERALSRALDAKSGAADDVHLQPDEQSVWKKLRLVGGHKRFVLALGGVVLASPFALTIAAFWLGAPLLVALAFFA